MTDKELIEKIQRAFGYADDQLVAEYDRVKKELEEEEALEKDEEP